MVVEELLRRHGGCGRVAEPELCRHGGCGPRQLIALLIACHKFVKEISLIVYYAVAPNQ